MPEAWRNLSGGETGDTLRGLELLWAAGAAAAITTATAAAVAGDGQGLDQWGTGLSGVWHFGFLFSNLFLSDVLLCFFLCLFIFFHQMVQLPSALQFQIRLWQLSVCMAGRLLEQKGKVFFLFFYFCFFFFVTKTTTKNVPVSKIDDD